MDLLEVMRTTFACREFQDEKIEDEVTHRILDSARFAPSGGNRQGVHVVVVKDQFVPKLNGEHSGFCWVTNNNWPKPLHQGLKHTLNDKSIKNKSY